MDAAPRSDRQRWEAPRLVEQPAVNAAAAAGGNGSDGVVTSTSIS